MDRLDNYYRGDLDNMLKLLEEQGIDIKEYLDGLNEPDFEIELNKKKYRIFQITELERLRAKIRTFEELELRKKIVDKYKANGINIERAVGGHRDINRHIDLQVDEIYNNVIQKYKVKESIEKQGYADIVFRRKEGYKLAPNKVGRPTENKKAHRLNVRVSDEQYSKLEEYAKKHNMKLSDALRELLNSL